MAASSQSLDEFKQRMTTHWNHSAAGYATWVIDNNTIEGLYPRFSDLLVPALREAPGVAILDVASASGEPGATLARALPGARVLCTDLVESYLDTGSARASRLGLTNIEFEAADAEDLSQYRDASFEAVTCSLGLMFMPHYKSALAHFYRVLKPGGILAVTVWGPDDRVPFFKQTLQLAADYDAGALPLLPTALRFGDPTQLKADLLGAGLEDVHCEELLVQFCLPKDRWWTAFLEMPLPIKAALAKAQQARPGEDVSSEAHDKMRAMLEHNGWLTADGSVRSGGNLAWFISAKKPVGHRRPAGGS